MSPRPILIVLAPLLLIIGSNVHAAPAGILDGTRKVWHPLTLTFTGPAAKETDDAPNPFLDFRLMVTLTGPTGHTDVVPGFFDGDGSGNGEGAAWRVRFMPDRAGRWTYRASFRSGPKVAIDLAKTAGKAVSFDGASGEFDVSPRDPDAPGLLRWGRLSYADSHYLKFQGGPYWIKGGTDEPENFLAYMGFDDTIPSHAYAPHESDWKPGDPDWGNGKGRAIIGALNYLGSRHVNSVYFLTMNVGGDGKDVWPWVGKSSRNGSPSDDTLHYDISKLKQWNIVFEHAQRQGIVLHFVFNEAEEANKKELDDGELGDSRKLYYREMIARFGHNPALEWNICEEYNIGYNLGPDRVRRFARYIREVDPYDHPLTVHSAGDPVKALKFTFGDSDFDLTSVQLNQRRIDLVTEQIRAETAKAGRPLPASMDEFTVDKGQRASHIPVDDVDLQRKQKLWPTYLSGGMIEFILEGLLKVDDFKTGQKEALWQATWNARKFLEDLPFWEMRPDDGLVRGAATLDVGIGKGKRSALGAQVFALAGKVYAIYLPKATETGELKLSAARGAYTRRWYNPRTGEFEGKEAPIRGGNWVPLGSAPRDADQDWAVLIRTAEPAKLQAVKVPDSPRHDVVFPVESWAAKSPEELGLDEAKLDKLAEELGSRGCVIKDGYVVKSWGSQSEVGDWFSSAKPVLSTLLMFAIREGKVKSPDQPIADFGWDLKPKDRGMTFRHLANMTSGYARPEKPGEAWSYNDFAIQLYQKTLFDKVFKDDPAEVANDPARLGALGLEDGLSFRKSNRRISASVRDFARIAWFWLNEGNWAGKPVLPRAMFVESRKPQVPSDLPLTRQAETDDYLKIGSYGGGSDHFSRCGPGIYGFNWWFNGKVRDQEDRLTWPDAPEELFMSVGARGNSAAILPSKRAILVAANAHWGGLEGGKPKSRMSRILKLFAEAVDDGGFAPSRPPKP
jgi:CubicO group peptidase (beta-lactamase class C family)